MEGGAAGASPPQQDALARSHGEQLAARVEGDARDDKVEMVPAEALLGAHVPDAHGLVERARGEQTVVVRVELDRPGRALVAGEHALHRPGCTAEHLPRERREGPRCNLGPGGASSLHTAAAAASGGARGVGGTRPHAAVPVRAATPPRARLIDRAVRCWGV